MLTVAKVTQGQAAGYADYLEGRSVPSSLGDYYLKGGDRVEAPGRWAGGALAMGMNGDEPVSGGMLRALMAVRRPDNGMPLRASGAGGEAVAAIDATFSAPKSISAVWAVADAALRDRIEQAHEQAIDRALAYATQTVAMVRERLDQQTVVHTRVRELIASSWRHTTARSVEGRPPDPQLHSHVLLHAAIRRDGQVVAIDSRSWLRTDASSAPPTAPSSRGNSPSSDSRSSGYWAGRALLRARGRAARADRPLVFPSLAGARGDRRAPRRQARRA